MRNNAEINTVMIINHVISTLIMRQSMPKVGDQAKLLTREVKVIALSNLNKTKTKKMEVRERERERKREKREREREREHLNRDFPYRYRIEACVGVRDSKPLIPIHGYSTCVSSYPRVLLFKSMNFALVRNH